jgi:hypothetical protein
VYDSEIANEKPKEIVAVPVGQGPQINGGGNGDAVSFRTRIGL